MPNMITDAISRLMGAMPAGQGETLAGTTMSPAEEEHEVAEVSPTDAEPKEPAAEEAPAEEVLEAAAGLPDASEPTQSC